MDVAIVLYGGVAGHRVLATRWEGDRPPLLVLHEGSAHEICISVKVAEGLVLAADSAVMLQETLHGSAGDTSGTLQSFEFANKVSQLKNYPIGVMSWGAGSIEDRSIQSLLMEFEFGLLAAIENGTPP